MLLNVSATYILPAASSVNEYGLLNAAAVPCPFEKPATPEPAIILVTPPGVTFLI